MYTTAEGGVTTPVTPPLATRLHTYIRTWNRIEDRRPNRANDFCLSARVPTPIKY